MNTIILSGMAWAASLKDAIKYRVTSERGQDLIEYAVLAGGIGLALGIAFLAYNNNKGIDFNAWVKRVDTCIFGNGCT